MTLEPDMILSVALLPFITILEAWMFFKLKEMSEYAATVSVTKFSMITESPSTVQVAPLLPWTFVFVVWPSTVVVVTIFPILTLQPSVSKSEGKSI